jgi:hypothetical protein
MKKRTEITIETERFLVISRRSDRSVLWCGDCDHNVPMLTIDEAAMAAHTTPLVISELAETGQLHFALLEGQQFICPNSLATLRA